MADDQHINVLARLMDVSVLRAQVHAGNIANQNTPGYKAKAVAFEAEFQQVLDSQGADAAEQVDALIYEPRSTGVQPDGNDVSMSKEIMESAKNQTLYDTYLAMAKGKMKLMTIASSQAPGG